MDGSDINYVETNRTRELLIAADDRACISLYRWPVLDNKSEAHTFAAHSEHVPRAKFSDDEKFIISIGG